MPPAAVDIEAAAASPTLECRQRSRKYLCINVAVSSFLLIVLSMLSLFVLLVAIFGLLTFTMQTSNETHKFILNAKDRLFAWNSQPISAVKSLDALRSFSHAVDASGCIELDSLDGQSCAFENVVYHPAGFVPDATMGSRSQIINMDHEGEEWDDEVSIEILPGVLHLDQIKGTYKSFEENKSYASYDVVVLGTRDWPNIFHIYYEQLWPIYALLAPWNLTNGDRPITAAVMNFFELEQKDNGYEHAAPNHSLVVLWEQLFNARAIDLVAHSSQGFTARTLIAGNPKMWSMAVPYNQYSPLPLVHQYRSSFLSFIAWIKGRFNSSNHAPPDYVNRSRRLVAVVISRIRTDFRSLVNQAEVVALFEAHNITTWVAHFENITFSQQVQILASADIFLTVHGAATSQLPLIPQWAVMIELKALGFGGNDSDFQSMDFQAGYCNLAKLSMRSLIQWHNRNSSNSWPSNVIKNSNMRLSIPDADTIIQKAIEVVHTRPGQRDFDQEKCIRMNEPVAVSHYR